MTLRIATRRSPLALWQARSVGDALGVEYEFVHLETEGDLRSTASLHEMGGQGVFVKEVQAAVLSGRADIAVHSAKDLPTMSVPGLEICAVPLRGEVRDALVGGSLAGLKNAATVATSSSRRISQLRTLRPDLKIVPVRGNIQTRIERSREHDALMVAAVALERLELHEEAMEIFSIESFCPQVGQGALAVECRTDDGAVKELLQSLDHGPSHRAVVAERAMLERLGAGCTLPVGGYAYAEDDTLTLSGFVGSLDGRINVKAIQSGTDPVALGVALGEELMGLGGDALLEQAMSSR